MKDNTEIFQKDATWRYDTVAKLFHWTIACFIFVLIGLGWYMLSIEKQPDSGWYFDLHKSIGLITATLIFLRLIWRFSHKTAPLPASVPLWQARSARAIHWLLYVCIILMPLTGFIGSSFGKYGVAFFGLQIPNGFPENKALEHAFLTTHVYISWVLVGLIALHILAAFKHLLINRDKTFQRMWF